MGKAAARKDEGRDDWKSGQGELEEKRNAGGMIEEPESKWVAV